MSADQQPSKPLSIHVTWSPEGERLSPEEQQAIKNQLMADAALHHEQRDKAQAPLDGLPFVAIEIDQLADLYARMLRLTKLGQSTLDELDKQTPEVAALKRKIFVQSDFGAVYAGQWLPDDVRKATREKVQAVGAQEDK